MKAFQSAELVYRTALILPLGPLCQLDFYRVVDEQIKTALPAIAAVRTPMNRIERPNEGAQPSQSSPAEDRIDDADRPTIRMIAREGNNRRDEIQRRKDKQDAGDNYIIISAL